MYIITTEFKYSVRLANIHLGCLCEFVLIIVYPRCLDDLETLVLLPCRLDLMIKAGSVVNEASYLFLCVHLDLLEPIVKHAQLTSNLFFSTTEILNLKT